MRLDKFLKVSRIIKRRTLAKELCDRGLATVNGRPAKAGTVVKPGDMVFLKLGSKTIHFEVLKLEQHLPARLATGLYRLLGPNGAGENKNQG
ncbi:MAG: RNA-binding S4 domain-containing protein [Candidatus Desulforudis sp.]|nr:RNA-binding S4 domain-containing protein [Desulforudis sp.]